MILLPASAELAANASTGPEGHKCSASVESGASSDATMVASDINGIDGADMDAVDASHKAVAIEKTPASPLERSPKRAACNEEPAVHDAKRGRVSTDTASGAPALATHTHTAGSHTTAAPMSVSMYTATALAVADPYANALNEANEASDAGQHEPASANSAPEPAVRDASAGATASSAEPEAVIAASTPAPASSAIFAHHGLAPASASTTTGTASALGAAASESDTIVANETSRGDAGGPETPVISRRPHVVAGAVPIRAFAIGRTSTPTPAPQAGGSKSAVIVANATSRVHAHCPSTPVVSRLPAPRSHVIPGATAGPAVPAVGNNGQVSALRIGLRCSATSTAAPTPAPATTPAVLPIPATALSPFELAGSRARRMAPQISRAKSGALRAVSRVVQRGMGAIRNALVALFKGDIEPTDGRRPESAVPMDGDGWWDEGAPVDAVLLGLRKRQRHRFL